MNETAVKYRHEFKYIQNEADLIMAESGLKRLLKKDPHVSEKGYYSIRSLYFDDYNNTLAGDNVSGHDEREKWRIRIYDRDPGFISLERKSRKADLISKTSCRIDRDTYDMILSRTLKAGADQNPLLNRFFIEMRTHLLHPVVIVEYERTPFIAKEGNTRVTIDRDIRSSSELDHFLSDKELSARPVLLAGKGLMEVKFDDYLPDHIAHTVETGNMRRETFSKYFLARKFPFNGLKH